MEGSGGKSEEIEIICPCGLSFQAFYREEGGEYACPKCGRVNILIEGKSGGNSASGTKGKTTVRTHSPIPQVRPGDTLGPYKITGFIGEGGMGRVYAAEDVNLQRPVAVKVLSQQLLDKRDFVARFEREARAIARLNNPNIVQIYYTGVHNELPYYAMEMVSGGSLEELRERGLLAPERAATLLLEAANGLAAAGAEGVIHRDIKPSNLMLDRADHLKITDFGLAKTVAIESAITHTGTIIGTPYYMSPEQGEGRVLDQRADIYSLGATFYHLLGGAPPYEADSPIGVILKHINEPLPPLRTRNEAVPPSLARVIEKMMAKRPEERYASYEDLIADLRALDSGPGPHGAREASLSPSPKANVSEKSNFVIVDEEPRVKTGEILLLRAGPLRRFLALTVDYTILYVLYHLYMFGYRGAQAQNSGAAGIPQGEDRLFSALFLIISFLYFYFGDARGGMTLGKTLFRCRVGRRDGENIGFKRSLVRTLLFLPLLFSPGLLTLPAPWKGFFKAYYSAGFECFFEPEALKPGGTAYPLLQFCFIWLFVNLGFLIVTLGKSTFHDLFSRSCVYAVSRKKPAQAPKKSKREESYSLESAPRLSSPQPLGAGRPPPIPIHALTGFNHEQTYGDRRRKVRKKNPMLAMALSLVPGLGQFYNGDFFKGIIILLTCWLIVPWVLGLLDAYFKARWINRRASLLR